MVVPSAVLAIGAVGFVAWYLLTHLPTTSVEKTYNNTNIVNRTFNVMTSRKKSPDTKSSQKGDVIVQLFEWRWEDIAEECRTFLPQHGYTAVQTSTVTENAVLRSRPWYERTQVFSYKMITRSGNESQFRDMVHVCNENNIKVYVEVILNHMSEKLPNGTVGTAGSLPDTRNKTYPDYEPSDFHKSCHIADWKNPWQVRNCELKGHHDLNQTSEKVKGKIVEFLNKLIDIGVAGFRVSDAKHVAVEDLADIYSRVNDLNTTYFPVRTRPYIYHEVSDRPKTEGIRPSDYFELGSVEDFQFSLKLYLAFYFENLRLLKTFDNSLDLLNWNKSVVFIDNQDTQRGLALNYKRRGLYKMAVSFMLAWPHSVVRVMSGFEFVYSHWGPPADIDGQIRGVIRRPQDLSCSGGWVCEHRWRQIYSMVLFRNTVFGSEVSDYWENGNQQIAFCRKGKGFVAFNVDTMSSLTANLQTCLPTGIYCDVISGSKTDKNSCSGQNVTVGTDGRAEIDLLPDADGSMLAIHIGTKLA